MFEVRPASRTDGVWLSDELDSLIGGQHSDEHDVVIDLSGLSRVHPLFAVQLQLAIDVIRRRGGRVTLREPLRDDAANTLIAFGVTSDDEIPVGRQAFETKPTGDCVVVPLLRVSSDHEIDELADATLSRLTDLTDDVAVVRYAAFEAVSELTQNGVEHGASPLGCIIAASRRVDEDSRTLSLAVGDLGIGIPDHLRRQFPEWTNDEQAIGMAVKESISGTGDAHRGIGFASVAEASLASAASGAELRIRAGTGKYRRRVMGSNPQEDGGPASRIRGTWINYEWTTIA